MEIRKMIRAFSIVILFLNTTLCYAQESNTIKFLTPHTLLDTLIVSEVNGFIKAHGHHLKNKKNALFMDIKQSRDETEYMLYIENDFYHEFNGNRVQYMAELGDVLLLISLAYVDAIIMDKPLFLEVIKKRCPDVYNEYKETGLFPVMSLYHNVLTWRITVKNGEIIDKEIYYD